MFRFIGIYVNNITKKAEYYSDLKIVLDNFYRNYNKKNKMGLLHRKYGGGVLFQNKSLINCVAGVFYISKLYFSDKRYHF